jgi:hypothetical protein
MRNRRENPASESDIRPGHVAYGEKQRAAAYANMSRHDEAAPPAQRDPATLATAPNGRPYDPRSGRYADR